MDWVKLFASPFGRIGRADFWLAFLPIMAASYALGLGNAWLQLAGLATLWPMSVIHIKRLHDFDHTGFLLLIPLAVSVLSGIVTFVSSAPVAQAYRQAHPDMVVIAPPTGGALLFILAATAFGFTFLLWTGLSKGNPEVNRYGEPPTPLLKKREPHS